MVNGKDYRQHLIETRNGCDKNCKECILYTSRNRCIYEAQEKWQEWAKNRHIEFGKLLERKTDET